MTEKTERLTTINFSPPRRVRIRVKAENICFANIKIIGHGLNGLDRIGTDLIVLKKVDCTL